MLKEGIASILQLCDHIKHVLTTNFITHANNNKAFKAELMNHQQKWERKNKNKTRVHEASIKREIIINNNRNIGIIKKKKCIRTKPELQPANIIINKKTCHKGERRHQLLHTIQLCDYVLTIARTPHKIDLIF